MIQERILELVKDGLTTGLVDPADEVYTVNRRLEVLGVDDIEDETFEKAEDQPAWTCLLYTSARYLRFLIRLQAM